MKKFLATCVFCLAFATGAAAQSIEAILLDNDTTLTIKCSYDRISLYFPTACHVEPIPGIIQHWSSVSGRHCKHQCNCNRALAQRIFLARLEKLDSPDIYRQPLSHEAEKIVYNFELLTGIRNSGDGDLIGWCYISHLTRNAWKAWFNNHKDRLCYCTRYQILYLDSELEPRSEE
jgi:hypothetical protein